MNKPNCYECKYRGRIPGSAHSMCNHPANEEVLNDPFLAMTSIFASVGRAVPLRIDTGLNVKGAPHGVRNGWFNFPFSYDPTWLERCDGFSPIKNPATKQEK